jgi:hypothetical protein
MRDVFIAKYQTDGELNWVKTAQGGGGLASIQSVAILDLENIMIGGYYSGLLSLDDVQLHANNTHGFVTLLSDIIGVEENETEGNLFGLSPNPVRTSLTISFNGGAIIRTLSIVNVNGETVYRNNSLFRKRSLCIDTRGFSKGIYFIKIEADKGYQTKKIIIN